jgi:hypothetical protein
MSAPSKFCFREPVAPTATAAAAAYRCVAMVAAAAICF